MQNEIVPGVSVIVCCYNSAKRLPKTIEHLAKQELPDSIPWEVIVVDNASTDDTAEVAEKEWNKYQLDVPLAIIHQSKAGLSYAREKGIEVASYEYCIFCDDDNWLEKNYVVLAYSMMSGDNRVGIIGGMGKEICEIEPPKWFKKHKGAYAIGTEAKKNGNISCSGGQVYGAGMILRKSVYHKLISYGFKSILSDRKATSLSSGQDTELCYAFRLAGYQIWFNNNLIYYHFLPKERLNKSYLTKVFYAFGDSTLYIFPYDYVIKQNSKVLNSKHIWLKEALHFLIKFIKNPHNLVLIFKLNSLDVRHYYAIFYLKAFVKLLVHNSEYDNIIHSLNKLKKRINEEHSEKSNSTYAGSIIR